MAPYLTNSPGIAMASPAIGHRCKFPPPGACAYTNLAISIYVVDCWCTPHSFLFQPQIHSDLSWLNASLLDLCKSCDFCLISWIRTLFPPRAKFWWRHCSRRCPGQTGLLLVRRIFNMNISDSLHCSLDATFQMQEAKQRKTTITSYTRERRTF